MYDEIYAENLIQNREDSFDSTGYGEIEYEKTLKELKSFKKIDNNNQEYQSQFGNIIHNLFGVFFSPGTYNNVNLK